MTTTAVSNLTSTLSEIRDDVYFLVGEDEDTFPALRVNRVINDSLSRVWDEVHREPSFVTTTVSASSNGIRIPDAFTYNGNAVVESVSISGGTEALEETFLTPQPFEVVDSTAENDVPEYFAIRGTLLYLYPSPDDTYNVTMVYRREFVPLTSDSDTTTMTDAELTAARLFAAYTLKVADEEFESAGHFKSMYDEAIGSIIIQETGLYVATQFYGGAY